MANGQQNRELIIRYRDGDEKAFEELVDANMGLVKSAARRFTGRGTELEDLIQIGAVGLIKAAKAYDLSLEFEFSTYAFSMIVGEIRRFLRDDGPIRVSRTIKKNCAVILAEKERYVEKFGCEPSIGVLAEKCGMSNEDAVLCLGALSPVLSFNGYSDEDDDDFCLEQRVGNDDIGEYIDKLALEQALDTLEDEERMIIELRYRASMTQSMVAQRLNTTQVRISRTEKRILEKLRRILQ